MRFHHVGALLIAGCGDPTSGAIEYDDVARIVGASIATADGGGTMGAIGDSLVLAFGGMPMGFTYQDGLVYGHHGDVEHRYTMIQCRDASNQLLKACNHETNLATLIATWSGAIHQPGLELVSSRQGMWTLANLQQWVPAITGSSRLQSGATLEGERTYALTATEAESMVAPGYMMGGAIQLELAVTRALGDEPSAEASIVAEVVFDAAITTASMTLDGAHLYRVDLATGHVEP